MKAVVFPGQGSQFKGMGKELFDEFPEYVKIADEILGYSIKTLCVEDPNKLLSTTAYTQPALYVVNALAYLHLKAKQGDKIDYFAGHSLGEFTALFASGAFTFEQGLRLVKKRAQLMSTAKNGAMAAIIGIDHFKVNEVLGALDIINVDVANYNSPNQTVVSGLAHDIDTAQSIFESQGAIFIKIPVSAAFHSKYMKPIEHAFADYLQQFTFASLTVPVISNVTGRPYQQDKIAEQLVKQLSSPVQWVDTIQYIKSMGAVEFTEAGPGNVLSKLISSIPNKIDYKEAV